MSRGRQSADRIREEVSMVQVLSDYGYEVYPAENDREQQFSCDLHGDGDDNTPSARFYPGGGQFFCFACGRSRDAIALVREKEGLGFWQAIRVLEKRYGLKPLPWEPDAKDRPQTPRQAIEKALRPTETVEEAFTRVERFLMNLTREHSLPPQRCAGLWEAFDRVQAYLADESNEEQAIRLAHKILTAAKKALNPEES